MTRPPGRLVPGPAPYPAPAPRQRLAASPPPLQRAKSGGRGEQGVPEVCSDVLGGNPQLGAEGRGTPALNETRGSLAGGGGCGRSPHFEREAAAAAVGARQDPQGKANTARRVSLKSARYPSAMSWPAVATPRGPPVPGFPERPGTRVLALARGCTFGGRPGGWQWVEEGGFSPPGSHWLAG